SIESERPAVRVGIQWRWGDGRLLVEDFSDPVAVTDGAGVLRWHAPRWPLLENRISLNVVVVDAESDRDVLDRRMEALRIEVLTPDFPLEEILVAPRVSWSIRKA